MTNEVRHFNMAIKYYSGEGNKRPDYTSAKKYFEATLRANPEHVESLYYLGLMAKKGQGGHEDLVKAKKYLCSAMEKGHANAELELFDLHENEAETGDDWNQIGDRFYENIKLPNRNQLALKCYKRALDCDSEHADALYNIGWLYEQGRYGVPKKLETARTYYRRALAQGHSDSLERLIEIYEQELTTAAQWYDLGEEFYRGNNNTDISFEMAMACYQQATKKDKRHSMAHYSIGWLYEHQEGVDYDIEKAKNSYLTAADLGSTEARKQLLLLENEALTTADEWYALGQQYSVGDGVYAKDLSLARICYEQALELDENHKNSLLKLGNLYEEGKGVAVDFGKAREFYERLKDKKLHLKRVEKNRVQASLAEGKSINERDQNNSTALHRAAQDKNLKLYATLKILGAREDILDKKKKPASDYLSAAEKISVTCHQKLFSRNLQVMEFSAPKLFASQITIQGASYDNVTTDQVIEELYKKPDLKPLFDLAKLATLGKHKLSGRRVVLDEGYDSDQEVAANDGECLSIIIDSQKRNVNGLVCRENPKEGTVGIYIPLIPNSLFIGGDRDKDEVRGTLTHELTHFMTREIFGGNKPYNDKDAINKTRFTRICNSLKKNFEAKRKRNPNASPNLFEIAFGYPETQYHSELIARIAQAIARSDSDLINRGQPEQDLLKYYREVFLVKVKEHIEMLTKKSYGGWSPVLFKQYRGEPYHLEIDDTVEESFEGSPPRSSW